MMAVIEVRLGEERDVLVDLLDALHDEQLFLELHRSTAVMEQVERASALLGVYEDEWL